MSDALRAWDMQFWRICGRLDSRKAPDQPAPSREIFTKTFISVNDFGDDYKAPEDIFATMEWTWYQDGWLAYKAKTMRLDIDGQ